MLITAGPAFVNSLSGLLRVAQRVAVGGVCGRRGVPAEDAGVRCRGPRAGLYGEACQVEPGLAGGEGAGSGVGLIGGLDIVERRCDGHGVLGFGDHADAASAVAEEA